MVQRTIILGAAGRDFHNFNVVFRDDPAVEVIAFTAAQIPNIQGRRYPAELAGPRYPEGIPIVAEDEFERLVRSEGAELVVFSYSDVRHEHVMHVGSRALAAGADFLLLGPRRTMLQAAKPVVAVCAARTGSGKSQTSRKIAGLLENQGLRTVVVRHPMPYGRLACETVQRFAAVEDLDRHDVTIEEREEYEAHLMAGRVVYAGVDYERVLRAAEAEAEVIVWDGGNNDHPFFRPDLLVVVVDPHRADHVERYHPGESVVRMADVLVINKVDTADLKAVQRLRGSLERLNPAAVIVEAASPIYVADGAAIRGKRVLVVEDGPTLTHGEMTFGAGWIAARRYGAAEIIDPRPYAVGSIHDTYARFPDIGPVLPAMGYGDQQVAELGETIRAIPADLVLVATPVDLRHVVRFDRPTVRVRYELQEIGEPTLADVVLPWVIAARSP